jgi:hypothetical protein
MTDPQESIRDIRQVVSNNSILKCKKQRAERQAEIVARYPAEGRELL